MDESGAVPPGARGLAAWLSRVAPGGAAGEVTIVLLGDRTIRRLNRRFARTDRVTDVLAFASDAYPARAGRRARVSGDVAIATGVARRQAVAAGHSYARELRVLALHGLLHLLGYDHHGDDGRMARLEARLRRKGGLAVGLIERARPL
jgi:probable rRNA maturation factor